MQVNVNFSSPSSTTGIQTHGKSPNVAFGRKEQDNNSNNDETVTDPEVHSDSSSTDSLYEESSDGEQDSSDNDSPKKPRSLVLEKKNSKKLTTTMIQVLPIQNCMLLRIQKKGVRKSRVRWGLVKAYFVMEKPINEWNEKKVMP